ncbi:MAG: hypothetical protein Q7T56_09160 [Nocardioidaceae bacterium]|nr:hypothetical protein [Nocardioidaceae bacterium]
MRWAVGITALVVALSALWPSIHSVDGLQTMLEAYPAALRDAFGLDQISTGAGYLDVELFSIVLPGLFSAFAISRGARLVAGDEESGALLPELVVPRPRSHLLAAYACATCAEVVLLGVTVLGAVLGCSAVLAMGIPLGRVCAAASSVVVIGAAHGLLALAVGAATGRRALAVGVAGAVAVAGYLLHVAGTLVTGVAPWGSWSPIHLVLAHPGLTQGWSATWWWVAPFSVVALVAGAWSFERRDVHLT